MTLQITDARLDGYEPGSASPAYQIPGDHIFSLDIEQKVGDLKDTGKVSIDNRDNRYTNLVDHGDRIEFFVNLPKTADSTLYGDATFGGGTLGGSGANLVWTGVVRDYTIKYEGGGHSKLQIDMQDFVFAIMGMRKVYNEWRDRQIVGSNGIINELLEDLVPEVSTAFLPDRQEVTSIGVFGESVRDVVGELALRLPAVPYSQGQALRFEHPDTFSPDFTMDSDDFGVVEYGSQDDNLKTNVRVRGGTDTEIDDQQLTQDGSVTVTDSSFATQRIDTRKSFVAEVDLYTIADNNGEDIIIRLQKDDGSGSGPIAPNDETSDISSRRLSAEFLDDDGFTLFELPTDEENVLPEPDPWMIVQTDGSTGQDIGTNTSTGDLVYRAFYPYPIVIEQEDASASAEYRKRDGQETKRSISTFEAARDRAQSFLSESTVPEETLNLDAQSLRMHNHGIGEAVQFPVGLIAPTDGAYIALEKKDHYEGNLLRTDFSFQSLASI